MVVIKGETRSSDYTSYILSGPYSSLFRHWGMYDMIASTWDRSGEASAQVELLSPPSPLLNPNP